MLKKLKEIVWWLFVICVYWLCVEGKLFYDWYYLIVGDCDVIYCVGVSVQGWIVSEVMVIEDDWDDYIIEDLV